MSNKTLKATGKKTKWARDIAITAFATALFLSFLAAFSFEETKAPSVDPPTLSNTCSGLLVKDSCYKLERADTNQARIKGLSDRDKLDPQSGMLFVFDNPAEQCIWMKDMRFSLDIIWLDETKKITKIKHQANPASYPETFCSDGTKYVIELTSGEANRLGLSVGQDLEF